MNLGERYWSSRLHLLTDSQKEALGEYPKNLGHAIVSGIGLLLSGNNSTGKTYIAAALCVEATDKYRVPCYMVRAAELKEAWIDPSLPANIGSQETVIERLDIARFLVIDDLGKEYRTSSGFSEVNLGSLLRKRSKNKQTTLITTNQSPTELSSIYSISTVELIKECMVPVNLTGVNQRDLEAEKISRFVKGT